MSQRQQGSDLDVAPANSKARAPSLPGLLFIIPILQIQKWQPRDDSWPYRDTHYSGKGRPGLGFLSAHAVGERLEGALWDWLRSSELGAPSKEAQPPAQEISQAFGKEPRTSRKLGVGLKGAIRSKTTSAVMLTESLDALIKRHELSLVTGTEKVSLETWARQAAMSISEHSGPQTYQVGCTWKKWGKGSIYWHVLTPFQMLAGNQLPVHFTCYSSLYSFWAFYLFNWVFLQYSCYLVKKDLNLWLASYFNIWNAGIAGASMPKRSHISQTDLKLAM